MNGLKYNKTLCTKMFNARFKALLKYVCNKYPNNIDFKTKVDILNKNVKGLENRIIINIFVDYILSNEDIVDNIKKNPNDDNIKFWDSIDFNTYSQATKRTKKSEINNDNPIFEQIKIIFKISNKDVKKYVIRSFNNLKILAKTYVKVNEDYI